MVRIAGVAAEKDVLAVMLEEVLLFTIEGTDIAWHGDRPRAQDIAFHVVTDNHVPSVLERDEATIKEVVDVRGKQQPVAAVKLLLIRWSPATA